MLEKPEVESTLSIIEQQSRFLTTSLENRVDMVKLLDTIHEVTKCWVGKCKDNKWSRHAYVFCFSTSSAGVDLYLSPGDSMKSLLSLFEAIQLLEFIDSTTYSTHVQHRAEYRGCFLEFNVYVEKSETCKMVPIYETKRVQVGTKVVCND